MLVNLGLNTWKWCTQIAVLLAVPLAVLLAVLLVVLLAVLLVVLLAVLLSVLLAVLLSLCWMPFSLLHVRLVAAAHATHAFYVQFTSLSFSFFVLHVLFLCVYLL